MEQAPLENLLLAGLPRKDRRRLLSRCEEVHWNFGDVLSVPGERIEHIYFPLRGFVSLLIPVEAHTNVEVELVGNEGMLGVAVALGVETSPLKALVQGSGSALRLTTAAFRGELRSSPALRKGVNRYICVLITQLSQAAACLSLHLLDARLARWLLMTHDRAHSDRLYLTHESLAQMLGVRRVGVTNAAGLLQKRKVLSYSRGEITILDRRGLEASSCNCYQTAKSTYERILG